MAASREIPVRGDSAFGILNNDRTLNVVFVDGTKALRTTMSAGVARFASQYPVASAPVALKAGRVDCGPLGHRVSASVACRATGHECNVPGYTSSRLEP